MTKSKETAAPKKLPTHGVYAVEGEGDRANWTRIGAAWPHQDGNGYNVSLSAIPLTGRLVIRVRTEKEQA
ncbi:MAG: hypothetical protein EOQ34_21450 [Mesorhizobium sp.]|nr:hypothetical protein [Mesorhizobium sp.]RWF69613.1 MAG: hypothetical protein EOQ34_21450 [Mesorhizobium sp.]